MNVPSSAGHLLTALFVSLTATPAFANDGVGHVAVGGIILGKSDRIAMQREVLEVGWKQIQVEYDFLNESDTDVTESIVFPLPPYGSDGDVTEVYAGQPNGFQLEVDGKPVAFQTHLEATLRDPETRKTTMVTPLLRSAGLSDRQIALFPWMEGWHNVNMTALPREKVPGFSPAQVADLLKKGLFSEAEPDGGPSGRPLWDVNVTYSWRQTFPARRKVHVRHRYTPFITSGIWENYVSEESLKKRFCADPGFLKVWRRLNAASGTEDKRMNATSVAYVLKTANTWKDGVRDFTLRIRKSRPQEIVSLCFPGTPRRVSSTTIEFHLSNFKPQTDLEVYFGNLPGVPLGITDSPGEPPRVP